MYAYFLLKNTANMLSIKNTNILMIPVSENILVESGCFLFLQNKIGPFLKKVFVSMLAILGQAR